MPESKLWAERMTLIFGGSLPALRMSASIFRFTFIVITFCRARHRSTKEHQSVDGSGIHTKICKLLASVRAPPDEIGSEEDRERREKCVRSCACLCLWRMCRCEVLVCLMAHLCLSVLRS